MSKTRYLKAEAILQMLELVARLKASPSVVEACSTRAWSGYQREPRTAIDEVLEPATEAALINLDHV